MQDKRVFIGTSGWIYNDWSERFYPKEVKGTDRLSFYARLFDTVEINATFYRNPTAPMIASWNRRLGDEFHLVVKGSRSVTHLKKLQDCHEQLEAFLERALQLTRLKVILWQLPPSLHKDSERLESFLVKLPKQVRHAVEFRHNSWWDDEVSAALSRHSAAFVALSHPRLPEKVFPTTDFLYLRFHGQGRELYRYDYSADELSRWVSILKEHLVGRTLYSFFNNDYQAHAIRNALKFRELLACASFV
jgi:uncharacterized protein YecE (DUF72 family)